MSILPWVTCHRLAATAHPDREGGAALQWQEDGTFQAVLVPKSAGAALQAGKEAPAGRFRVLAERDAALPWHQVFSAEGRIYRVISAAPEEAPEASALDLKQVLAEEWRLP